MKITVYTIKDCAFSKQEKEYLNTNKLVFEEKDLETNKDFLTEMLAISNNFAGTPVTRVEKDDGTIAVLKGFTRSEFDTTFGFSAVPTANPEVQTATPPINDTPIPPVAEVPPVPQPESVSPAPVISPVETPATEPTNQLTNNQATSSSPDPLKSVMDDLQAKVDSELPPVTPVEQPVQPGTPELPTEASAKVGSTAPPTDAPTIPDFPTKQ